MPQPATIWCWPANGQYKGHKEKFLEFENNTIGCTTFAGWLTLSVRAYHTCTISFTCVFATPYLLNNLILTLSMLRGTHS